ncbi:MAG TPA: glycosyltransferase family 4 protein [Syntrophorhabdaceae bacterium]|nr:glycosyltransferase family 4 protein [Syntrophorhabdaceae bacterium]
MRIGLAIYNFNPKKGGAERYAFDLSMRLLKRGHEVYVVCRNAIEVEGIRIVRVSDIGYPRWLRTLFFALNHRKVIRTIPLDIVLGFGNTLELDVYQSHGGVQKIWMDREIKSYDNPAERAVKAIFLKTSINQRIQEWIAEYPIRKKRFFKIIAISHMVRRHMSQHFCIPEDTIEVVYNGVDTERFKPVDAKPDGRIRILFSGGNFRLKGLSPLLNTAARLAQKGRSFEIMVMGRGKRRRYDRMIDRLDIGEYVRFMGETSSPEIAYRESHLLAHPTFYDACSLTTMEAMASGLPVITTRWNGASALVSEAEGYVIDEPYDIDGLHKAIDELFDREKRERMGRNARLKLESFTMEQNAMEMERIFFEVRDAKHRI